MNIINITGNKKYRFKFLFFLSILTIIYITYYKYIDFQLIISNNRTKFDNILPKLNLNTSEIPNIDDIFRSSELYIGDSKLTKKYIKYIRSKNLSYNNILKNKTNETLDTNLNFSGDRKNQWEMNNYYDLCQNEKFISNVSFFNKTNNPVISVLVISYNKKDIILKSIRSIQNQSLKNIEIIIVNDKSTDKSEEVLKQLLETDKRIRIFNHLKNMGAWRSRLDAFLYSNAPYVIHFDAGDFYADNYVLEDAFYLANKFDIDSVRFGFRLTKEKHHLSKKDRIISFKKNERKILYGRRAFSVNGFKYGTIWNRMTKADVFTRGLYHLDEFILNSYKNLFEDRWWNTMANNESYSYLMTNRIGYIYLKDSKGEGNIRSGNKKINEKTIKEIILFFLFDYNLAYNKSDKNDIINKLKTYQKGRKHVKLSDLKSYFPAYNHLLNILIKDKYVSKKNKLFLLSLKHNIKYSE